MGIFMFLYGRLLNLVDKRDWIDRNNAFASPVEGFLPAQGDDAHAHMAVYEYDDDVGGKVKVIQSCGFSVPSALWAWPHITNQFQVKALRTFPSGGKHSNVHYTYPEIGIRCYQPFPRHEPLDSTEGRRSPTSAEWNPQSHPVYRCRGLPS